MKNKKLNKELHEAVSAKFIDALRKAFLEEFHVGLRVTWNIWHLHLISYRMDGVPLTKGQSYFIEVYEAGFVAALKFVDEFNESH